MWSKNKKRQSTLERWYVGLVKSLPCSVCDAPGPSEAHEPKQGKWFICMALCSDCHRNPFLGLGGQKRAWVIRKMDEWDALAVTIMRVVQKLRSET